MEGNYPRLAKIAGASAREFDNTPIKEGEINEASMCRPTLTELPSPPRGKTGWPWNEEPRRAPDARSDGSAWPRISIVTPSYNQGKFIEKSIRSVLLQNYPNLEYIIIDGGSTDNTVEVIRKYGQWLHYWVSEEDEGQSDAINKGSDQATGGIFNWLNSDDFLEPGALFQVAEAQELNPEASGWAGGCRLLWASGRERAVVFPNGLEREHLGHNWNGRNLFQPACFLSLEKVLAVGGLDSTLHYCLDLELYLRLLEQGELVIGKGLWATATLHPQAKTQKWIVRSYLEVIELQKKLGFLEGARNRYDRMFAKERLEYVMPPSLCDTWVKSIRPYTDNGGHARQPFSFYNRNHICFVGDFAESHILNAVQYFHDEIFPLITPRHPKTNLHIFGKNCDRCNHLGKHKNVKVMGEGQDMETTLRNYKLFVYPLLSNGGVSTEFGKAAKIGLPIVTSSPGAQGYPVKDGEHCFIADDSGEFAQKCNHLLEDPPTWGNFSARLQIMMSGKMDLEKYEPAGSQAEESNEKKAKITVVQGRFPVISATFILDQITGLLDRGFDIENWARFDPNQPVVHSEVKKYRLLEKTRYLKYPPEFLRDIPEAWLGRFQRMNEIGDFNHISAFHVHYGENFNSLEPLFRCVDTFVVVSFHGYDASTYFKKQGDFCYEYLFKRANLITTPSHYLKNELERRGCPPEKIQVHRCGVDLKKFCPNPARGGKSTIHLLTVARMVEKKGIEYSLKAFSLLPNKDELNYRIVGDGPLERKLKKLAHTLGIAAQVDFLGPLDKDGVIAEMSRADICVLTSVTAGDGDQEGLPVSLIEAQAMGLPVVSSYHAGIPDLVKHGQTGLLSEEKDVNAITKNLDTLISNKKIREEFARNARERVKEKFDIHLLNNKLARWLSLGESKGVAIENKTSRTVRQPELYHRLLQVNWQNRYHSYEQHFGEVEYLKFKSAPCLSAVLVSSHLNEYTNRNLEILSEQSRERLEVIWVRNCLASDEPQRNKPFVDTMVTLNSTSNHYIARNIGAVFARAPILLFLDDQAAVSSDIVEAYLKTYAKYLVIAVRGACLMQAENSRPKEESHYYLGNKPFPRFADLEGNVSYNTALFFRAEGWDEEMAFPGGGIDLSRRLLEVEPDLRKQIYTPAPVVYGRRVTGGRTSVHHLAEVQERLRLKYPDYPSFLQSWEKFAERDDLLIEKKPLPPARKLNEFARRVLKEKIKPLLLHVLYPSAH